MKRAVLALRLTGEEWAVRAVRSRLTREGISVSRIYRNRRAAGVRIYAEVVVTEGETEGDGLVAATKLGAEDES